MPRAHDFFVHGDQQVGQRLIADALASQGFTVTATPSGGFLAKRGSTAATFWLGALAGDKFQLAFTVDFMVDTEGRLVARLNRNMTGGALKGGALGAAKTNTAFQELANAIAATLHRAGVLAADLAQI